MPFASYAAAAQLEIPRSQLADWDASARSWLKTADMMKSKEQDELMFILNKIQISVHEDTRVFPSVISTWVSALKSMEMLLNGTPQAVNSGPLLIALGAWYIYPEIIVLGDEPVRHHFDDPLIPNGGMVTLGLARPNPGNENDAGIHWVLSFAHLRYYGKPILRQRKLSHDSSRLTFDQFVKAAFGSLLGLWLPTETSLPQISKLFVAVENAFEAHVLPREEVELHRAPPPFDPIIDYQKNRSHWFHLLADAARSFTDSGDASHETTCRLVRKGFRSSSRFIGTPIHDSPFFDLLHYKVLDTCLDGPEARIQFLRKYARSRYTEDTGFIIRYYLHYSKRKDFEYATQAQFATVFPYLSSSKRKRDAMNKSEDSRHSRWLTELPNTLSQHAAQEYLALRDPESFIIQKDRFDIQTAPGVWTRHTLRFGNPDTAAIFHPFSPRTLPIAGSSSTDIVPLLIEDLLYSLETGLLHLPSLLTKIETWSAAEIRLPTDVPALRTLDALSTIFIIYKLLPDATISINSFSEPLHQAKWVQKACMVGIGLLKSRKSANDSTQLQTVQYAARDCSTESECSLVLPTWRLGQVTLTLISSLTFLRCQQATLSTSQCRQVVLNL